MIAILTTDADKDSDDALNQDNNDANVNDDDNDSHNTTMTGL